MKHKEDLNKLLDNPNNIILEMSKEKEVVQSIDIISQLNKHDLKGYIVFNNCRVSDEIQRVLGISNSVVLIMSKGKIKTKMIEINADSGTIYYAIKKSLIEPDVIIYDKQRDSYQFYVSLPKGEHRLVIQFDAVPLGIKGIKTNIIMTIFKESDYRRRIENIKKGNNFNLSLFYEARGGCTALVPCPQSRVFDVVAPTSREHSSACNINITNDDNDVKSKK